MKVTVDCLLYLGIGEGGRKVPLSSRILTPRGLRVFLSLCIREISTSRRGETMSLSSLSGTRSIPVAHWREVRVTDGDPVVVTLTSRSFILS